ncbi:MAG: glycoside hydrolase family 2 [Clostridiales bacterium]|nr:glycoside hydrolase family 2 [Clostridiales bacterium]
MTTIPRPEYPRPNFVRNDWKNLNGQWEFSFDTPIFDKKITVPFCYQSKASGIQEDSFHEIGWYRRSFSVNEEKRNNSRLLLNFGAVDYIATIWVNGVHIGEHKGGHTGFSFDITQAVQKGDNELIVKVQDGLNTDQPRGKQSWKEENFGCWYTPTTGIWQSVWLEYAGSTYLKRIKITPDVSTFTALCELFLSDNGSHQVLIEAFMEKEEKTTYLAKTKIACKNGYGKTALTFDDLDVRNSDLLWTPEHPNLINVKVTVQNSGEENQDEVLSYFGLRSIGINNDQIFLNQQVYYQRLILDQGYWPDTLLTPPSDEAIIKDIELTKAMGFNGARKHQKIEDPRYYYWADKLGLLVWGEMPSCYAFNDTAIENLSAEMLEFVNRDYNHPCIVAWVPINESWGVVNVRTNKQQQDYVNALIYFLRALDPMRIISGNDGWEQTNQTDISALHDYDLFPSTINKYDDLKRVLDTSVTSRALYADGHSYQGQPVLMTEYGGISFAKDEEKGWGYHGAVKDEEAFIQRLEPITSFLIKSRKFSGYCYTQLTDVMQEVNGLLDENRDPKIAVEKLNAIFGKPIFE